MRAFVAVDISPEARLTLAAAVDSLQNEGVAGVRWVRPSGIHVTLKFLGEIDPGLPGGILDALRRTGEGLSPFRLGLAGLGAFPRPEAARVIWAGLDGDVDQLKGLQRDVDREVSPVAGLPPDKRPFAPHLTLGRVRGQRLLDSATGDRPCPQWLRP